MQTSNISNMLLSELLEVDNSEINAYYNNIFGEKNIFENDESKLDSLLKTYHSIALKNMNDLKKIYGLTIESGRISGFIDDKYFPGHICKEKPEHKKGFLEVENERLIKNDISYNISYIYTGPDFGNIICFDIDNKENTIKNWYDFILASKNDQIAKTLIITSLNKGLHYFYKVTDEQYNEIKNVKRSGNETKNFFFNDEKMSVDIMYEKVALYGPGYLIPTNNKSVIALSYIANYDPISVLPNELLQIFLNENNGKNKVSSQKLENKQTENRSTKNIEKQPKILGDKNIADQLIAFSNILNIKLMNNHDNRLKLKCAFFNEKHNFASENDAKLELKKCLKKYDPNYNSNEIDKQWLTYKEDRKIKASLKTIKLMAYEQNSVEFMKIQQPFNILYLNNPNDELLDNLFQTFHIRMCHDEAPGMIVRYFIQLYEHKIIFIDDSHYIANNENIWIRHDNKDSSVLCNMFITILKHIQDYIGYKIAEHENYIKNAKDDESDINGKKETREEKINKHTGIIKEYTKINKNICENKNNCGKMDNLILLLRRTLKSQDYHETMTSIIDKFDNVNPNILPFNNFVYDFISREFRQAKLDEYLTTTTGYSYNPPPQTKIDKIKKLLEEICGNDYEFIVTSLSLCCVRVRYENMWIFIGRGRNGKGVVIKLMSKGFGCNLFTSTKGAYLAGSSSSKDAIAPDSLLANSKAIRGMSFSELPRKQDMNVDKVKALIGGDPIDSRDLYKKRSSNTYDCKFKMFASSNNIPSFGSSTDEENLKEKLFFIKFRNMFVTSPNAKKPHQKLVDIHIKDEIDKDPELWCAFMKILIDTYNSFIDSKKSLKDLCPEDCKNYTKEALETDNSISEFISEAIEITGKDLIIDPNDPNDQGYRIRRSDIYPMYKSWCLTQKIVAEGKINFYEKFKEKIIDILQEGDFEGNFNEEKFYMNGQIITKKKDEKTGEEKEIKIKGIDQVRWIAFRKISENDEND